MAARSIPEWEDKECNKRLVHKVAQDLEINISQVEGILQHYAGFIARTIRAGALEGVCVPYLGKFQVKLKGQQYKAHLHSLHPVMKKIFQKGATQDVKHLFEP